MKSWVLSVIFLGAFGPLGPSAEAAPSAYEKRLRNRINRILVPKKNRSLTAGISVYSLDRNEMLYSQNGDKLLIPASTNKLLTAYVALKKLGPAFEFETKIYAAGDIEDGTLKGDVYLKGGGDPFLVSERMWMLVNDFMRHGVNSITGNIIGDATFYDQVHTPKTRPTYLRDQAYNAPVGALSFNFNSTAIWVRPGNKVGAPVIVHTDPPNNSYIDIVNQARTGKKRSRNSLALNRIEPVKRRKNLPRDFPVAGNAIGDTVLLRGRVPKGTREVRYYRNIVSPTLYTGHMFRMYLERRGVRVQGSVKEGKVPSGAKKLVTFKSPPLWQLVWGMNKFSNNFTADQILKRVGAKMWGAPGTLKKGVTALEDVLEDIGIPRKSYTVADGSGLTRKTKITANQLIKVLVAAQKDFNVAPEFSSSLGIAGVDGTMRRRLSNKLTAGTRAKTGSLDGVNSLAGYLTAQNGERLAFVVILNSPPRKYGRMTGWVDRITTEIARLSR